ADPPSRRRSTSIGRAPVPWTRRRNTGRASGQPSDPRRTGLRPDNSPRKQKGYIVQVGGLDSASATFLRSWQNVGTIGRRLGGREVSATKIRQLGGELVGVGPAPAAFG